MIRTVAVVGAGAMGAMYAAHTSAAGFRTLLVATGDRANRLRDPGLTVNGEPLAAEVVDPTHGDHPCPTADLVIIAVKHGQLEEAAELITPLVADSTTILSVLNGLDSEEVLAAHFGEERVPLCIALAMDAEREGTQVRFRQAGRLVFGERTPTPASASPAPTNASPAPTSASPAPASDGAAPASGFPAPTSASPEATSPRHASRQPSEAPAPSARLRAVQEALTRAGLEWQTPPDMPHMMWWKFMVNVGVNQASAVLRAPYGAFQHDGPARELMMELIEEVRAVGRAEGVDLGADDLGRWDTVLAGQPADGMTSMHQDVLAGRPTEVEIFAGRVVELGRRHGIPTPHNQTVLWVLRHGHGGGES